MFWLPSLCFTTYFTQAFPSPLPYLSIIIMGGTSTDYDASGSGGEQQSAISSFSSLPSELREKIVELACGPFYPWSTSPDRNTCRSLLLTCKNTYDLAAPILYRHLEVARPSILADLASTLVSKPTLGTLIKSLHLGPTCHCPSDYWPLGRDRDKPLTIRTSLEDKALLPRWCPAPREWPLVWSEAMVSCKVRAVHEAIETAAAALGVDLFRVRWSWDGGEVTAGRWLMGVLEVQAALDLYLMALRRLEDSNARRLTEHNLSPNKEGSSTEPTYPPLSILPSSSLGTTGGRQGTVTLNRADLLAHLAERGGNLDYFDHPLVFVRSSIDFLTIYEEDGHGNTSEAFLNRMNSLAGDCDIEQLAHIFSLCAPDLAQRNGNFFHTVVPDRTTTGGNLANARMVLAHAPQIEHLSLSSYLQLLLWRSPEVFPLRSLRSLCFGLLYTHHEVSLHPSLTLHGQDLAGLEKLNVSGYFLAEQKVAAITGLPGLKEVTWEMSHDDWIPIPE